MNKKLIKIIAATFFLAMFFIVNSANASFLQNNVKTTIDNYAKISGNAGYETGNSNNIFNLVQTVINVFLSIIGVLLLVYILYAGYNWMTAQGEEEKVTKAKETIQRAIVGVIIIIAAYAISMFVMSRLEKGTLKGASAGRTMSYFVIPASASEFRDIF